MRLSLSQQRRVPNMSQQSRVLNISSKVAVPDWDTLLRVDTDAELSPAPPKKLKPDTVVLKSPVVIRKSDSKVFQLSKISSSATKEQSSRHIHHKVDRAKETRMNRVQSCSSSSTVSLSFTVDVLNAKKANEDQASSETVPEIMFLPCDIHNSQRSKLDYVQTWVNTIEDSPHDPLPLDTSNNIEDSLHDPLTLDNVDIVDTACPSPTVFTTPKKQEPMVTSGTKRKMVSSTTSSSNKQTSITAFFTPNKVASPSKVPDALAGPSRTAIQELTAPVDEIDDVQVISMESAPEPKSKQQVKTEWSSILSRMRGTAANVSREMRTKQPVGKQEKGDENSGVQAPKSCPFYKRIPNTGFVIDAFCYGAIAGVSCYFLSHYHYDHYRGLGKWLNRPMYCSQVTANLVQLKIKLDPRLIRVLPLNQSRIVENVEVVLLDANHCPGAVMFLFRFATGHSILHVGDFRADPAMEHWKELNQRPIDHIYLDTTYCDEHYNLPPQREVLDYVRRLVRRYFMKHPNLLVVSGTYTIGKEKVFMTAAEELDCSVWAPASKRAILTRLDDPALCKRLVTDPLKGRVHVVNISDVKAGNLAKYMASLNGSFTHILALHPTGWEYDKRTAAGGLDSIRPKTFGKISIYGIPYSEHSGFDEMKRFVTHFRPKKIIPTVNVGSAKQRQHMNQVFNTWLAR